MDDHLQTLLLRFRRGILPPLSTTAAQLLQALDLDDSSVRTIENIIASDPALAADVLRLAAIHNPRFEHEWTLRRAIQVLGQRAMRSLAVSLLIREAASKGEMAPSFDSRNFARHSLAVAFFARYLFSRRQGHSPFETELSADEIFAAGVVHDLGIAMLAKIGPEEFERIAHFAKRARCSGKTAFSKIYGQSSRVMTVAASEAYGLPDETRQLLKHMDAPWLWKEEYVSACCLAYANELAHAAGFTYFGWDSVAEFQPEIELEVRITTEEFNIVRPWVEKHVTDLVEPRAEVAA